MGSTISTPFTNVLLRHALSERIHATMQVNTARASGALSVIPGCLQEYRRESINVLGNVLITVNQLRELSEESGMVEMPELPEFSHHAPGMRELMCLMRLYLLKCCMSINVAVLLICLAIT